MEKQEKKDASQASMFFKYLFEQKEEDNFLLLFSLPGERSTWFDSLEDAASWAEQQTIKNTYFGVALTPDPEYLLARYKEEDPKNYRHKIPATIRCQAKDTVAIPGLWIDLDWLDPTHKKKNLPKDLEDTLEIINRLEFQPSLIINSGGGLQAWWKFNQLWQFEDAKDRNHAALLVERFQTYIKQIAYKMGQEVTGQPFDVDSTHDLARIFRVPGTLNVKDPKNPKIVKIIEQEGATYNPQEIESYLDKQKIFLSPKPAKVTRADYTAAGPVKSDNFRLDAQASPNFNAFMVLLNDTEDRRFRQSWEHKRKDFVDQSASSYDLSLATLAVAADWETQEIINLLIAHRREHSEQLKLDRADYYQNTLNRARAAFEKGAFTPSAEVLKEQAEDEGPVEKESAIGTDKEAKIFKEISEILGVKVERFIRYLSNPTSFQIVIDGKKVVIGDIGSLMSQTKFKQAVYLASRIALPNFKAKMWNHLLNQLGRIEVEEEPDETETEEGLLRYWLRKYLSEKALAPSVQEGIADGLPWQNEDGRIAFQLQEFKQFTKAYKEFELNKSISSVLNNIQAERSTANYKSDTQEYKSRACWLLPNEFSLKKESAS